MYSMHKKNNRPLFHYSSAGFLLTEFIIAFAVLTVAVLVCSHSFLSTVHEYSRAKQRLRAFAVAQNNIERSWAGKNIGAIMTDVRMTKRTLSIERGIMLPNMPVLKQEWIEIESVDKKAAGSMRLRGLIKEG